MQDVLLICIQDFYLQGRFNEIFPAEISSTYKQPKNVDDVP